METTESETLSSPLAYLPLELVYHALCLASISSRTTALACARVSSGVRRATACELYRSVILRRPAQIHGFVRLLLHYDGHREGVSEGLITRAGINPGPYVRNLIITHHVPTPFSTPTSSPPPSRPPSPSALRSWKVNEDPYEVIFAFCPQISRAVLQASFLHSSLVPGDPVNRMPWLTGGELVVLGPVFPSDWEAHVEKVIEATDSETKQRDDHEALGGSILSQTTHLTLLEPLSSPHVSARAIARLSRLTHIALRVRPPHPLSVQANNPFVDVLPLLASPSIVMVVILLETWHSPHYRTSRSRTMMEVEEFLMKKQKATENMNQLDELAQKMDERVYVVERMEEPSGSLVEGWRVESEEDVWERALSEREQRNMSRCSVIS